MTTMKAVQISKPGGDFELVERDVPAPSPHQVLIKVEACGVCYSDVVVKEGVFPWLQYPRIPGHEVVGTVAELGDGVRPWKVGQRVGVGWHGGHCFTCDPCRSGDFMTCEEAQVTGVTFDGGYAEYMLAPQEALARVPDELSAVEAAPLLCAGITCFNALRHSGGRAGDLVAVQGIGGLGHLGIQYARAFGFRAVAISRGGEKRALAEGLGAHSYIDTSAEDPAEALQKLGGARVILATAPEGASMSGLIGGLGREGNLVMVGIGLDTVAVPMFSFIVPRQQVTGWPNGTAKDSEETMAFSVLSSIRPTVETFGLERAGEAYARMMANEVRFRAVLMMS